MTNERWPIYSNGLYHSVFVHLFAMTEFDVVMNSTSTVGLNRRVFASVLIVDAFSEIIITPQTYVIA